MERKVGIPISAGQTSPSPLETAYADLAERRVGVVGAGRTGIAISRFLSQVGARGVVTDTRTEPPGRAAMEAESSVVAFSFGALRGDWLREQDLVVLSPGISQTEPAIQEAMDAGVEVIGEVELFGRYAGAPVIAVTGSNGKSTVTTLIGDLFRRAGREVAVGGNLGVPALDLLGSVEPEVYVLEISSFQAESLVYFRPWIGVLLNLSPDHLDRYSGTEAYFQAKMRLFEQMGPSEWLVFNGEDRQVREAVADLSQIGGHRRFHLGLPQTGEVGLSKRAAELWFTQGTPNGPLPIMRVADWPLTGEHNLENALAALAVGVIVGLPEGVIVQALSGFSGLHHRMERVAVVNGVTYFNDSKGTNVGAVARVLRGLPGRWVWLAGGVSKGGEFSLLFPLLRENCREAILFGEVAEELGAILEKGSIPFSCVRDLQSAVQRAAALAEPGESVVLSPGCASFDQYPDFAARGEDFRRAVYALEAEEWMKR